MEKPVAFFCRAKPQDADALEIFKDAGYVFIGHPMMRDGAEYDPHALRSCLVDPTCSDEEWEREIKRHPSAGAFNKNRNLIKDVKEGSIVVVPRPEQGAAYVARITGPFEIVDSPPWANDYLELRRNQGCYQDDQCNHHVADVAQGWPINEYRRVDLSLVPGWMRRRMFGRSTYLKFVTHPIDLNTDPFDVLDQILKGQPAVRTWWTLELEEIKRRLIDTLTANAFENLIVSLLQLENPTEIWHQTGGPGDGGVDGLGSNDAGEVVGLMQAKLYADSIPNIVELGPKNPTIRRYAAVLVLDGAPPPNNGNRLSDGTYFLDLQWVAEGVKKHWKSLPQARAMRVEADEVP